MVKNESNLAGLLLMLGGIIILITIYFEYHIGWIGEERMTAEVPYFILDNWSSIKWIWSGQTFGYFLATVASLLLLKNADHPLKTVIWASVCVFGLLVCVAFGITIGSYAPALKIYDTQPELFDTFSGAIRSIYSPGLMGFLLMLFTIYIIETVSKEGRINKKNGLIGLSIIILGIALGPVPSIPAKVVGAVVFLFPVFIGYAYWKN